nr:DUF2024 family protein [Allomuricauda sp.]
MEIAVWDTYVQREDGKTMHFDILVPSEQKDPHLIFSFGRQYLASKNFKTGKLTAKECRFCHMQSAPPEVASTIELNGYYIIEMENCT